MKFNNYMLLAAAALTVALTGCKKEEPFDTQSPDDYPRILYPVNESGSGTFTYDLENPETVFPDSAIVSPSEYTTVRWYVDGQMMHEGLRFDQTLMAGLYDLKITASTEKAETFRTGTITVHPYSFDPYSEANGMDRHVAPGSVASLSGTNLDMVQAIRLYTKYNEEQVAEITTFTGDANSISYLVPEIVSGTYHVVFVTAEGALCGANKLYIHEEPLVTGGFDRFTIGKDWIIAGMSMDKVTAVQIGATTVTDFTATATELKLVGPEMEEGDYTLILWAGDKQATFLNKKGEMISETIVTCQAKAIILICEDVNVGCNGDPDWTAKRIDNDFDWSQVAVGTVIYVEAHRDAATTDYNNFQIMTPDWGFRYPDADHNLEFDGENAKIFEITVTAEMLAAFTEKGMGAAGHGTVIDRVYYDAPEETVLLAEGDYPAAWSEQAIRLEASAFEGVRDGATIKVYYRRWAAGDPEFGGGDPYWNFRVIGPWWGPDIVAQIDITDDTPNPYEIEYTQEVKDIVTSQGAFCCVGFGYSVTKITWK